MEQLSTLLARPEVQTAAAPFLLSLIVALLLRPLGWTWSGLSLTAGFYTTAYLINVFKFMPLTSTSKLLALGLAAAAVGLAADLYRGSRQQSFPLLFLLGAVGAVWLIWPILSRQELAEIWPSVLPGIFFLGWMAAWSDGLRDKPIRATSAGWVLGLSVGAMAVIGASASLGQLGIALGVAAGAVWLLTIPMADLRTGSVFALTALTLTASLSLVAVFYAKIPWFCLLPLAAVPPLALIPLPQSLSRFAQAVFSAALIAPFGFITAYLTWRQVGGDAPY
ncbi:MAG: hypothetical protein KDK04_02285 [Candidatus Competibacteraceae bacterium]|nr:hypothetical protein [Candidatus Competibacteraceae bacterium]